MNSTKWVNATVVGRTQWTRTLFSLRFECPEFEPFVAGQFARVGLRVGDEIVGRPYSLVNPPGQATLEIYCIEVENGPLSPKLNTLSVGDTLYVAPKANGFFSISEIPAAQTLWCIATGTGIGPFLSILRTPSVWTQFQNVVLVHGARSGDELTYRDEICAIRAAQPYAFQMLSFVSRQPGLPHPGHADALIYGRIPQALASGELERVADLTLDQDSQIMLCGNPQMVIDMIHTMEAKGLRKHRKREPGHYTTEAYW